MTPRRKYVAHHEAGHAVAAIHAVRNMKADTSRISATIEPSEHYAGAVFFELLSDAKRDASVEAIKAAYNAASAGSRFEIAGTAVDLVLVPAWVAVICLAGPIAAASLTKRPIHEEIIRAGSGPGCDGPVSDRMVEMLNMCFPHKCLTLDSFLRPTRLLMRQESRAVKAVARSLLQNTTLSYDQIFEVAAPEMSGNDFSVSPILAGA